MDKQPTINDMPTTVHILCPDCGADLDNGGHLNNCPSDEHAAPPRLFEEAHPTFRATGCLTRAFCRIAPGTNRLEFSLYYDDGKGNGDHIFTLPLEALEMAVTLAAGRNDDAGRSELTRSMLNGGQ